MKKQTYMTGEFARLCKVNKKTLFHYDKIGLFKPSIVENNGYRYYTFEQIDVFSRIRALQSIGMSLVEIQKLLHSESITEGIKTLDKQKQTVRHKIAELVQLEATLDQTLAKLKHYDKIGCHRIFIESSPEEYFFADQIAVQEPFLVNYIFEGYNVGAKLNYDSQKNELTLAGKFRKNKNRKETIADREKEKYLAVYFLAEESNIIECAKDTLTFIQNSNYPVQGEVFIEDVACDFINFSNQKLPFKMVVKIDEKRG